MQRRLSSIGREDSPGARGVSLFTGEPLDELLSRSVRKYSHPKRAGG